MPIIAEKRLYSLVRENAAIAVGHVFNSFLHGLKAGIFTVEVANALVPHVAIALLKALSQELNVETIIQFGSAIKVMIQSCFESGGEMAGGVQPPPAYRYPMPLVEQTLKFLVGVTQASLKRTMNIQAAKVWTEYSDSASPPPVAYVLLLFWNDNFVCVCVWVGTEATGR